MKTVSGFENRFADANGVRLHYRAGGSGAPLVLLHGFPQTSWEWREILPRLAGRHTVIALDLRGLGDSERPASGYDKRTAATDVHELMRGLGHERYALCGHDIGALVALAGALTFPGVVTHLAFLDQLVPGFGLEASVMDCSKSGHGLWHFPFHMAPVGVPEMLLAGKEGEYLAWHHQAFAASPDAVSGDDVAEYVRTYREPGD